MQFSYRACKKISALISLHYCCIVFDCSYCFLAFASMHIHASLLLLSSGWSRQAVSPKRNPADSEAARTYRWPYHNVKILCYSFLICNNIASELFETRLFVTYRIRATGIVYFITLCTNACVSIKTIFCWYIYIFVSSESTFIPVGYRPLCPFKPTCID